MWYREGRPRWGAATRSRGRARAWLVAAALLLLAAGAAVPVGLSALKAKRLAACREVLEPIQAARRIKDFFSAHRNALIEGAIDLSVADVAVLEGNLRLLRRILEDDYLLEARSHRSPPRAAGAGPVVFSAHDWLAGKNSAPLRSRLLRLRNHALSGVRAEANRALGLIAARVPEALAVEPLSFQGREQLRGLIISATGEDPQPAQGLRAFLREVLLAPGDLKVWFDEPAAGPAAALGLALAAVLALEEPAGGSLAEAVMGCDDLSGPDRALQVRALAHTRHPQSWRRLVRIAAGDGHLSDRLAALEALRFAAPAEAVPALRELADRLPSGRLPEALVETLEHATGDRLAEGDSSPSDPLRLDALRRQPTSSAAKGRVLSALRFHQLHPQTARAHADASPLILSHLASPSRDIRIEAVKALAALRAFECLAAPRPRQGAQEESAGPSLLGLLADPDLRIMTEASRAVFRMTAFWPPDPAAGGPPEIPGSPALEIAADPIRLDAWRRAWEAWRMRKQVASPADLYLEALESGEPYRAAAGARGLASLAAEGASWYAARAQRVLSAVKATGSPASLDLFESVALAGGRKDAEALWKQFEPAFRTEPAAAWEIVRAVHRLLSAESSPTASIDGLLGKLAALEGASAALVVRYLDTRFPSETLDARWWAAIGKPASAGPRPNPQQGPQQGASPRANLARWFPRSPSRDKARSLIALLGDPELQVRFWAHAHLKELARPGPEYDPAAGPLTEAARTRWLNWAETWQPPPP